MTDETDNGNQAAGRTDLIKVNVREIYTGKDIEIQTYDGRSIMANVKALRMILPGASKATEIELAAFLAYAQANRLDPFRRQVYIIKYKEGEPAAWVTSWEVFLDRAQRHPQFNGYESGVVWMSGKEMVRGQPCDHVEDKEHQIVGGWAKVYRKDRDVQAYVEVPIGEMQQTTRDGSPTRFWRSSKTTMATKVPLARALRRAFPEELSSMFTPDEIHLEPPQESTVSADVPTREERKAAAEAPEPAPDAPTVQQQLTEKVADCVACELPLLENSDAICIAVLPRLGARVTGKSPDRFKDPVAWTDAICRKAIAWLETNGVDPAWLAGTGDSGPVAEPEPEPLPDDADGVEGEQ